MSALKKYGLDGKELGKVEVGKLFLGATANSQMVKDYIVAIRANLRQWSASTKGRSEVKHTTKKPHPQKKLGRARQGCLVAPQFKGGGIVFGPKPKFDQHVRINKKEKRSAVRYLISQKIQSDKVIVLEKSVLETPSTKTVAAFLKFTKLKGKVLFLGESEFDDVEDGETMKRVTVSGDKHVNFSRSVSNIPDAAFSLASNISGYDLVWARSIVVTEEALLELEAWLKK